MEPAQKRYRIFASVLAVIAAMVISGLAVLFRYRPETALNAGAAVGCFVLSTLVLAYYLSFHQLLKHKLEKFSTIIVAIISAASIWLVISQTGGLDSPYLALWLAFVAALGVLGRWEPILAAVGTIAVYGINIATAHPQGRLLGQRLGQLGLIIIATGVGEWLAARPFGQSDKANPAQANASLSEEQLKTQALMSSMGEGVIVVNAARQVQLFNRAAQLLTGWDEPSAKNLDYRTVLKLKTAKDQDISDNIDPFMQAWRSQTGFVSNDLVVTTQAGRKFSVTITTSPIYDAKGTLTGGIALFRDISAEKEVERQRNEFISTASHEMRTPIAAIEGYIALATNPTTGTIDDRAKGYLDKAHQSIQDLGELFKNLLVITKLEDKQLADKIEAVNLTELVKKAVEDMTVSAQKKGLTLKLSSAEATNAAGSNTIAPIYSVQANPERLREVTMNLIENAIKYTPAGQVSVSLASSGGTVTVGVTDTGMGIASEDLPHLFQKFYRIDNSATRTIGGTGLGLYICRTIIELYNGRIWAKSQLGQGSTFYFQLPLLKNEAETIRASSSPQTGANQMINTTPLATSPAVPIDAVQAPAAKTAPAIAQP